MTTSNWTILIYIAAHNNLEELGKRSLWQLLELGSNDGVTLAALFDGPNGAKLYEIPKGGIRRSDENGAEKIAQERANFDSGDPDQLLETAAWVFEQHKAERYGLVLWSHGTGWEPKAVRAIRGQVAGAGSINDVEVNYRASNTPCTALFRTTLKQLLEEPTVVERAICFDDGSQHAIDTVQLENVMKGLKKRGFGLELLGMDACLMGTMEVAYQLAGHVRYYVASEELVPGTSWPYSDIMGWLLKKPEGDGEALAKKILEKYAAHYRQKFPGLNAGDVTKIALDLSQVKTLSAAVDAFAEVFLGEAQKARKPTRQAIWDAQIDTELRESIQGQRTKNKFQVHLWDVASVAKSIRKNSQNKTLCEAADVLAKAFVPGGAIVDEVHVGDWFDNIGGLSVYAPMPNMTRKTKFYAKLKWAQETQWAKLLETYHT